MNPLQRIQSIFKSDTPQVAKNELVRITDPTGFRSILGSNKYVSAENCIVPLKPEETYEGFIYAAITRRANAVATMMVDKTQTERNGKILDPKVATHEYLELIAKGKEYSEYDYWYFISVMLDLTGDAFIHADRGVRNRVDGSLQVFSTKGLNPLRSYYVKGKYTRDNEVTAWEYRKPNSNKRLIMRPEQMLHIKEFNPFAEVLGHSLVEAANAAAYIDANAAEHTASALKNTFSASGILSTGETLTPEQFENFDQAITEKFSGKKGSGKPVIANGGGALNFSDVRYDLNKMALETIRNLSREDIIAIFGVSKTMLGIEQSGVTRDSSRIQKELFNENHVIPRCRRLISEHNRDFKRLSTKSNRNYKIALQQDIAPEVEKLQLENEGIRLDNARKYYELGVSLPYIQEHVLEIEETNVFDHEPTFDKEQEVVLAPRSQAVEQKHNHVEGESFNGVIQSAFKPEQYNLIISAQDQLRKDVQSWQKDYENSFLKNIKQNALEKKDEKNLINDLAKAVSAFYLATFPSMLKQHGKINAKKFAKSFVETKLNKSNKVSLKTRAKIISESHNKTIASQLEAIIATATEKGLTRTATAKLIREKFKSSINLAQATRIAVNETSYAFNESRHIDDLDFVSRHSLDTAKYVWRTNSSNPEAICLNLAGSTVQVTGEFYSPGSTITATGVDGKLNKVSSWEHSTGRPPVHVNCMCSLELII